jgi:hypothetical protein
MKRPLALCAFVLGIWSAPARADVKVGDTLALQGGDWKGVTWTFGTPNADDAAGKVVIHWFCTPKVPECVDDLARMVTLRENGGVYIVAYINASARDAKKLDPIRESEGVGHGAVATGAGVKKLFKSLGIAKGPYSIVVDVDGKIKAITTSGDINELDARDTMVKQLIEAVRPYSMSNNGPTLAHPTDKLAFTIKIQLASWNSFSQKTPIEMDLTAAKDLKCDTRTLKADQMKIEGKTLTATITCTAPKGVYQARGELRFGYVSMSGATGLGAEAASWKFEVQ